MCNHFSTTKSWFKCLHYNIITSMLVYTFFLRYLFQQIKTTWCYNTHVLISNEVQITECLILFMRLVKKILFDDTV